MSSDTSTSLPHTESATHNAKIGGSSRSLIRGTGIVGAFTLLSRLLGFVRDLLFARLFGGSYIADAFFVAFRVPNLLRSFVAEGALTSAFVPVFSSELHKGESFSHQLLRSMTSLLLLITGMFSLLGVIFAPDIVSIFAPGFGEASPTSLLCGELLRFMMPYIMFVSLVAMLNGALNSVGIFGAAAFAQVAMNSVLICGALIGVLFHGEEGAKILAFFVLIGGAAQILVQIPALRKSGFRLKPARRVFTPATLHILKLMLPAILGAAVYQLSMYINTVLASMLQTGSVSWLFFADRVSQLPIGVFTVALASVLLPTLANSAAKDDQADFAMTLVNALRYTSFVMVPVSIFLFLLAEPIIEVLFQRGAFTSRDSLMTAAALRYSALGLWGVGCHSIVVRGFLARKDTTTPALIGVFSLLLSLTFALVFMGAPSAENAGMTSHFIYRAQEFLSSVFPMYSLGHAGLALATSSAATVAFLLALLLICRQTSPFPLGVFLRSTLSSLLAALPLFWIHRLALSAVSSPLVGITLATLLCALSYLVLGALLRQREIKETFLFLRRRVLRKF